MKNLFKTLAVISVIGCILAGIFGSECLPQNLHIALVYLIFSAICLVSFPIYCTLASLSQPSPANRHGETPDKPQWLAVQDNQIEVEDHATWRVRWSVRDSAGEYQFVGCYRCDDDQLSEAAARKYARHLNELGILPEHLAESKYL